MNAHRLELLREEMAVLERAAERLEFAINECRRIGIKEGYSPVEDTYFESLTGKFRRSCDYLVDKVFRTVEELDLETHNRKGRIDYAEKKGLIADGRMLAEMYAFRNRIVHEYQLDDISAVYEKTLQLAPRLLDCLRQTLNRCRREYLV